MNQNVLRYCGFKLLEILTSLVVLATLTFFLLKFLPGAPFEDEKSLNPVVQERLQQEWRLNDPWYIQAGSYLSAAVRGDLGVSLARPDREITEIISQGLKNTLTLNIISLFVVVLGGVALSILAMSYRGTWIEELIEQIVIIFISLPSLFWGPLLIFVFGFYWNLLPVALLSGPAYYILPLATLCVRPLASLTRLLKNTMKENVELDYVRTAHAKGLSRQRVLFQHVLRNSLIPFLSYLGPLCVSLLSGSILVEMLFAVPGLGTEFLSAINDRDYTLIAGLTLFYGILLILANSFFDIMMRVVDPRLREKA